MNHNVQNLRPDDSWIVNTNTKQAEAVSPRSPRSVFHIRSDSYWIRREGSEAVESKQDQSVASRDEVQVLQVDKTHQEKRTPCSKPATADAVQPLFNKPAVCVERKVRIPLHVLPAGVLLQDCYTPLVQVSDGAWIVKEHFEGDRVRVLEEGFRRKSPRESRKHLASKFGTVGNEPGENDMSNMGRSAGSQSGPIRSIFRALRRLFPPRRTTRG